MAESGGRKLGENQQACLDALKRHGQYPGGWVWENHSTTVSILESLVRRGLVTYKDIPVKAAADSPPRRIYFLVREG